MLHQLLQERVTTEGQLEDNATITRVFCNMPTRAPDMAIPTSAAIACGCKSSTPSTK